MRVGRVAVLALGLALLVLAGGRATAQSAPPATAPRLVIEAPTDAQLAPFVAAARSQELRIAFRYLFADIVAKPLSAATTAALRRVGTPVWVGVAAPLSPGVLVEWRQAVRTLVTQLGAQLSTLEVVVDAPATPVAAFAIRAAAVEARAVSETVRIAVGGAAMAAVDTRAAVYDAALAPYVDVLSLPALADVDAAVTWLETVDPGTRVATFGHEVSGTAVTTRGRVAAVVVSRAGTPAAEFGWPATPQLLEALTSLASVGPLLADGIVRLDPAASNLRLAAGTTDVTAQWPHRLFLDEQSFSTFAAITTPVSSAAITLAVMTPVEATPSVLLLDSNRALAATASREAATGVLRVTFAAPPGLVLVSLTSSGGEVFGARTATSATRTLTIDEIIARHQQQQRAQDSRVRNYMASAVMDQHFRPNAADSGYDVVTENRYYVEGDAVEWEELSFSVNGSRWTSNRPAFPLLQPEKVLALPLQLRFDDGYTYRLAGHERVDGFDCYVVRFAPTRQDAALSRGTVWIDQRTFARVQVNAVQDRSSGPVVSNDETFHFAPVAVAGGPPAFLFTTLTARQVVLVAGRNILVEKNVRFTAFAVNAAEFVTARVAARRSERMMYRETPDGLREYVKQGDERVISTRGAGHAKAIAGGVLIDPSLRFPLPLGGINYLDFEFGSPNRQLALLFAGVLAAGNIQQPRIAGTPFDASVDFFGIAVPSFDQVFDDTGQREGEALLTWPLTTGLNLGWQYTAFQKLLVQYQFRFDGFARDSATAADFAMPSSTITSGIGGGWEYRRAGVQLVLNSAWFTRASWAAWGLPTAGGEAREPARPKYVKYSASLSKDFFVGAFQKVHLNAAWFGGRHLDRFSKYQFGMFDETRVHGVPTSGVRFEQLGMARGSYSFNLFDIYRLDLFLDQAWGRDRATTDEWQPITGLGVGLNMRVPWNTILRVDAGKSFLPARYREQGSATLQVMFLKPLR